MNPIYPTDIEESEFALSTSKEPLEFSSFMEEESSDEFPDKQSSKAKNEEVKEEEDDSSVTLMAGPLFAPLIPLQTNAIYLRLLATLPAELKALVEPLPAIIQTSIDQGITQTKIMVELPSQEQVEVVIDRYDTAPGAFHISFYGSEQTAGQISQKQNLLLTTLQTAFPNFSFAISPPFHATPSFFLPKSKRLGYSPVKQAKRQK